MDGINNKASILIDFFCNGNIENTLKRYIGLNFTEEMTYNIDFMNDIGCCLIEAKNYWDSIGDDNQSKELPSDDDDIEMDALLDDTIMNFEEIINRYFNLNI